MHATDCIYYHAVFEERSSEAAIAFCSRLATAEGSS